MADSNENELAAFADAVVYEARTEADELQSVRVARLIAARDARLLDDRAHFEEAARILRHLAHRTFAPSDSLSAWLKADNERKRRTGGDGGGRG